MANQKEKIYKLIESSKQVLVFIQPLQNNTRALGWKKVSRQLDDIYNSLESDIDNRIWSLEGTHISYDVLIIHIQHFINDLNSAIERLEEVKELFDFVGLPKMVIKINEITAHLYIIKFVLEKELEK